MSDAIRRIIYVITFLIIASDRLVLVARRFVSENVLLDNNGRVYMTVIISFLLYNVRFHVIVSR